MLRMYALLLAETLGNRPRVAPQSMVADEPQNGII